MVVKSLFFSFSFSLSLLLPHFYLLYLSLLISSWVWMWRSMWWVIISSTWTLESIESRRSNDLITISVNSRCCEFAQAFLLPVNVNAFSTYMQCRMQKKREEKKCWHAAHRLGYSKACILPISFHLMLFIGQTNVMLYVMFLWEMLCEKVEMTENI